MPHKCVRCNRMIEDGSKELLEGCSNCGSKFFYYIKKDAEHIDISLTKDQINEIEKDVRKIIGDKKGEKPIILDIETIKTLGPGKFEIDINSLMKGKPVVINISDGKYYIDLSSAFSKRPYGKWPI